MNVWYERCTFAHWWPVEGEQLELWYHQGTPEENTTEAKILMKVRLSYTCRKSGPNLDLEIKREVDTAAG